MTLSDLRAVLGALIERYPKASLRRVVAGGDKIDIEATGFRCTVRRARPADGAVGDWIATASVDGTPSPPLEEASAEAAAVRAVNRAAHLAARAKR